MSAPATKAADPEARWAAVFAHVIGVSEGFDRFTDDPADRGGATKDGVSLRFLAGECKLDPKLADQLKIGHDGAVSVVDIRNLTHAQAGGVYRQCFWDGPQISGLPLHLDAAVFDQAVNDGVVPAVELLQRALNSAAPHGAVRLPVDGHLGPATLTRAHQAVQALHDFALSAFRALAADRYRTIVKAGPSQEEFLSGWLSRAGRLGDV